MRFTPTALPDVLLVDIEPHCDERGFFARAFCAREFREAGLEPVTAQTNVAFTAKAGTMRGLHYQLPPAGEAKLVRPTRGRIFDVSVDMRPDSPTRLEHVEVTLDADDRRALYVPPGFAHGYLTLADDTEVTYQVSEFYTPGREAGVRWNDPRLAIAWPRSVDVVSEKDARWPSLDAD